VSEKRALITGVTGQDGSYLAKFLIEKGYSVYGTYRRLSTPNLWRLQYLGLLDKINLIPMDLDDSGSILNSVKISDPDEIYHLASQSFVDTSFVIPESTANYTGIAVTRFLEATSSTKRDARFYFAASSEMFGETGSPLTKLDEKSAFAPRSPYAIAKLYGYWTTRMYRSAYKMFTVNGILFNHESPLRGLEFVTRKISNEVAKISLGLSKSIRLGRLDSSRDWGYAPEYVQAMWKMIQQPEPGDYVIATGEPHTVLEFVSTAFSHVGLDYEQFVQTDKKLERPAEVYHLCGDSRFASHKLDWKPNVRFAELVAIMVDEDIKRWKQFMNGEKFPWDAFHYPSEVRILSRI
jgi:GDPmannose 4,6-dehydratase